MDAARMLAEVLNQHTPRAAISSAQPSAEALEQVSRLVYRLLDNEALPRLRRKLAAWPAVQDDVSDLCQISALAFLKAFQNGRIRPEAGSGQHTAASVCAYLHGICKRVFLQSVRRSGPRYLEFREETYEPAILDEPTLELLLGERSEGVDEETRVWEALSSMQAHCRPRDLLMMYMYCNGFSIGELRSLFGVSINTPAQAFRRVGEHLKRMIVQGANKDGGGRA